MRIGETITAETRDDIAKASGKTVRVGEIYTVELSLACGEATTRWVGDKPKATRKKRGKKKA